MYDPHLAILDCPKCHAKGKVRLGEAHREEIYAYVYCNGEDCGFFVDDVETPTTTEVAKELLRIRAIRKWNTSVKEWKVINGAG